jgi:ribose transport system substrate-binding protein
MNKRSTPILRSLACVAALGIALTGCTNTGSSTGGSGGSSETPEGTQQSVASAEGPTCSLEQYKGEKIDLKDAVVGFSQSEKEDNPFRIAETQSIKDEAEKLGVKKLITTNAQSTLSKQISDIQDMISQGAQVLIVAPLNSDGLEPALKAAREKNIPVITIDRKVNATPCEDYVTFLGSNFVEQGKRAADQLIAGTDGKAKVAILLGSSGNAVTTDRTKGFKDQVAAEAPDVEIVAEQTGDFARDKGQSVTEQLLQANPDITAIYAENDEMGYNGVIESNPRFGPLAFKTITEFMDGKPVGQDIIIADSEYDPSNAEERLNSAY